MQRVDESAIAALHGGENDLPQRATEVDAAVKTLVADAATNTDGIPMRELLGLDEALRR